jgi:hypothetical protein
MGLFSKKKAEATLFERIFQANGSSNIWGSLPGLWYQDLTMIPLQESGIISKRELDNLRTSLFDVQGQQNLLVPQNFLAELNEPIISSTESSPLRDLVTAEFAGTQFDLSDHGVLSWPIEDGNAAGLSYTRGSVSFHLDGFGKEFGYTYLNIGFLAWPFSPDYVDLEGQEGQLDSLASGVNALSTKVRAPVVLETFMAVSEALVLGAKKNFYKAGRKDFADKERLQHLPKPKFRILPTWPLAAISDQHDWTWGYLPQVLQIGWTFTSETLKDKNGVTIISDAPSVAYYLFAEGCRDWPVLMDQLLGTPTDWAQGIDRGVYYTGELLEFMEAQNYNGSPNTLVYNCWLERFAKGAISMAALEGALVGLTGEEEIIARGNLSLANLIQLNFDEAEKLARSVLQDDPGNSEAVYVLDHIARLAKKPELLELTKKAREQADFRAYSAPSWLMEAVISIDSGLKVKPPLPGPKLDNELLGKLVDQFKEFVRVLDKLEFVTVSDAEGLRPWVQMWTLDSSEVALSIGSSEPITFTNFPWCEPSTTEYDTLEYSLPISLFADPIKLSSFLGDVFESYNELEIEIEPKGHSAPRMKTYFPVVKRSANLNPGLAAAAGVAAVGAGTAAATYTPRFFFAATSETQAEEPPSFDWF